MDVRTYGVIAGFAAALVLVAATRSPAARAPDVSIERGRYLVTIGACNDCHTPGWRESDGTIPVNRWMTGSTVGLRYAWGTAYPANVRLWFSEITEDQWLTEVRTRGGRMQWHDLRGLTLSDQRSIYRFIHSLGPKGTQVPDELPPGRDPTTPYIDMRVHVPTPP